MCNVHFHRKKNIYIYIKIYKHITSTSTNVHIYQLDDKYNNAYYRTIKMKLVDVKLSIYILILIDKIIKTVLKLILVITW